MLVLFTLSLMVLRVLVISMISRSKGGVEKRCRAIVVGSPSIKAERSPMPPSEFPCLPGWGPSIVPLMQHGQMLEEIGQESRKEIAGDHISSWPFRRSRLPLCKSLVAQFGCQDPGELEMLEDYRQCLRGETLEFRVLAETDFPLE